MRLRSLSIHNFGSIRSATIDFDKLGGVTVVEGPNGSGKTYAFIEAPTWLLLGKTVRKISADSVKTKGVKEKTVVSGIVDLDDGRTLYVQRSRPGGLQYGFSASLGTDKCSQEDLENLLGVDYKLFTTSVVFGGAGVSSFCGLTDPERKRVLDRILDTERYLKAGVVASDKLKIIRNKMEELQTRYALLSRNRNTVKRDLDDIISQEAAFADKRRDAINDAKREIRTLKDLLGGQTERLAVIVDKQKKVAGEYEERHRRWEARIERGEKSAKRAREIVAIALADYRLAEKELEESQEVLDRIDSEYDVPDVCPTCGTPRESWPDPKLKPVDREGPLKRVEKAHVAFRSAKKAHIASRKNLDECDRFLREEGGKEPEAPSSEKVEGQKKKIAVTRTRIKESKKRLKSLRSENRNPYTEMRRRREREIKTLRRRVKLYRTKFERVQNDAEIMAYWSKNFRNLAAMLLDEAAPFLGERSRKYAELLMDGRITINFDPSKQGRGKSFLPVIVNNNGGDSYDESSKGERARIDLCILLALRDLMESRLTGKFSQIFLDEVFDGLDDEGIESVTSTLKRVFKGKSVFLITHNPSLKNAADHVIEVVKYKGETVLTEAADE